MIILKKTHEKQMSILKAELDVTKSLVRTILEDMIGVTNDKKNGKIGWKRFLKSVDEITTNAIKIVIARTKKE